MNFKRKILLLTAFVILLSCIGFFIWKNTTTIKFEGEELVLNETLVTLKEGEFIKSNKIEEENYNYEYIYNGKEIAKLGYPEVVLTNGKLNIIEGNTVLTKGELKTLKNSKIQNSIYEFDFENNTLKRKINTKGYRMTAFEAHGNDYYLAYLQTTKYRQKEVVDEDGILHNQLFVDNFSSEISNPINQKSVVLENQYVYFLMYEDNKIYAFLSKDYSSKKNYNIAKIAGGSPVEVFIYDKDLHKIDEVKHDKEIFIKEKTAHLKKFESSTANIKKSDYEIIYQDTTFEQQKQGYYTEVIQYKQNRKIKSKMLNFSIFDFTALSSLVYQPEGYLVLAGGKEGFIKLNVGTLEYEEYPIKGAEYLKKVNND